MPEPTIGPISFQRAFARTFFYEGRLSDDAGDAGGLTVYGITTRDFPEVVARIRALPPDAEEERLRIVREFYWTEWWLPLRCEELTNRYVAAELFDSAVNCGPGNAKRFAQHAANLISANLPGYATLLVDGVIGPKTIAALNGLSKRYALALVLAQNLFQGIYYYGLRERKPQFIRGWMRRLSPPIELLEADGAPD